MIDAAPFVDRRAHALRAGPGQPQGRAPVVCHHRGPESVGPLAAERGRERLGQPQGAPVERHPDLRVGARRVQPGDLLCGGDAAGDGQPRGARRLHESADPVPGESTLLALAFDEGHQEGAREAAQLAHAVEDGAAGALGPSLHDDLALPCVQRRHHAVARQCFQHLRDRGRPENDLCRPPVQPSQRRVPVAYAAAHPAGRQAAQLLDDFGVRPPSQRGVQVDDRDFADPSEALGERARVAGLQDLAAPLHQLHRLAVHEVDGWDDQRTGSLGSAPGYAPTPGEAMAGWASVPPS